MSLSTLSVSTYPIYLPNDTAPVPFGQPLPVTCTDASPGVFTAVGYAPVLNDMVAFSPAAGVALPTGLEVGTIYFVVSPSNDTFEVSLTEGGTAITTSVTTSAVLHIINSAEPVVDLPFKPGYSVVVYNPTGSTAVLEGAPDSGTTYGYPAGPGNYTDIVSVAAYSFSVPVVLNADWIRVTSGGPLSLLQV